MAEVLFRARLTRDDSGTPWGFRLQGGADYKKPLTLLKVVEGSIASKSGLHHSDILVKLAGKSAEGMTHKAAQEAIIAAGNSLEIIVERAEATIHKSPPDTPDTLPKSGQNVHIETMVFESSKLKQVDAPTEVTMQPLLVVPQYNVEPSFSSAEQESSENIPVRSSSLENISDTVQPESFVKDPAAFHVNRLHRPGSRRRAEVNSADNISPDHSSSSSADSLEADNADFVESPEQPNISEEKLLSTADDSWPLSGARSSRSPIPPGGEAWRREYQQYKEEGNSSHTQVGSTVQEAYDETNIDNSDIGTYSTSSSTMVQEIRTIEIPQPRVVVRTSSQDPLSYPWRTTQRIEESDTEYPYPESLDLASESILPDLLNKEYSYGDYSSAQGHVGVDEESDTVEESSLMLVGRRNASPSSTVVETSTNHGPSPHISVTPSSPPSGLTVLPLSQIQNSKSHEQKSNSLPYNFSQLSQEMSDIKQEALRLMSNNAYHSPRLEDISFSTGGPEVVDIPMPAVKEMVEDLSRRLEAIAAQQPKIAQPPTAQELGISYMNQRRKELEEQADTRKEIFIDMPPADMPRESYSHRFLGSNEAYATNSLNRLYNSSSPILSPNYHSSLNYRDTLYYERGSSPRNQRRVHFADPPEQSVIEIEGRNRRRRRKDKDRSSKEEVLKDVPRSKHDPYDISKYVFPSVSSVPSPIHSATDVLSYSSSSTPVIIETPAGLLEPYQTSPSPSYDYSAYAGGHSPVQPGTGHPSQFSVSITHKKSDQPTPTRLAFTLPSGQPGQPTHFRYTMSGSNPIARTPSPQLLPRGSDAGLTYSLPPRYEDSIRSSRLSPRSYDDYYLRHQRRGSLPIPHRPHNLSPQPYSETPAYVRPSSTPISPKHPKALSPPTYLQRTSGHIYPIKGTPTSLDDTTQSKSFRALEAHYTDGSYDDRSSRVQILGTPQQVLQPVAVGHPFPQMQEPRTYTPSPPLGAVPGPPPAGSHDIAGAAIGPGLFALFDPSFTDKFVQWQQSPRSHFESETYKLIHEMEGGHIPRGGHKH